MNFLLDDCFHDRFLLSSSGEICQAAADGDLDYLKMLVENGIDPNVADYDSRTSLHLAASNNRLEILKYLCRIPSISINAIDRTGAGQHADSQHTLFT